MGCKSSVKDNNEEIFENEKSSSETEKIVIWIDPNINNDENLQNQKLIKNHLPNNYKILIYDKIENGIKIIESFRFIKTFIILSAKLIEEKF